jgi:hypothetical protein
MTENNLENVDKIFCPYVFHEIHPSTPLYVKILIIIHQTFNFTMKFKYSLTINDPQIEEKQQNSSQIYALQQLRMKI